MSPKKPASNTETAVKKAGARVAATVANAKAVMPKAEPAENEPTPAPAPARASKTKKTPVASTTNEVAPTTPAVASGGITLADLAERYLKHLEATGKSRGTVFSYSLDLNVAARHFGMGRDAATLTRDEVAAYFDCPAVTTSKGGAPKSIITTTKLRRTLRLALVWAAEAGLIAEAPIPPLETKGAKEDARLEATSAEADEDAPLVITNDPAAQTALGTLKKDKRGRKPKPTPSAAHSEPVGATGA